MRPSRFTEDEIDQALRQVKAGAPVVDVCRQLGITHTTFYRWRSKHDGGAVSDVREARELRVENQKLRHLVADLLLDRQDAMDARHRK